MESYLELKQASRPSGHRPQLAKSRSGKGSSSTANGAGPTPPRAPQLVPTCANLLKGAESVKKAAQALGLSTEFAAINAVAAGYGRAVCGLLQVRRLRGLTVCAD